MLKFSAVRLSAITSKSEKRGITPLMGIFPRLSTRLFENFLHMSRIFTKFETKLYMLKIFSFLLFGHYKVTKNQRYVQLFLLFFCPIFISKI